MHGRLQEHALRSLDAPDLHRRGEGERLVSPVVGASENPLPTTRVLGPPEDASGRIRLKERCYPCDTTFHRLEKWAPGAHSY